MKSDNLIISAILLSVVFFYYQMESQDTVSLNIEIDAEIHSGIKEFLEHNSTWDQNRLFKTSVSLFLIQNPQFISPRSNRVCSQAYLHSICSYPN